MTNVKIYAPNSVRKEVDGDVARWAIYINDELVEICPVSWSKEQAEARLDKLIFDVIDGKKEITDDDLLF